MTQRLSDGEKEILLSLARQAIEKGIKGEPSHPLDIGSLSETLRENGASFVTLTVHGVLRGCIGSLEAYQPLAEDVLEHACAAAFQDPRFSPVVESELKEIRIEISRLTIPQQLKYSSSEDLLDKLRPHVDGVILKQGHRKATFLPQVWEKIPDPAEFLDNLCYKMGANSTLWRDGTLQVLVYQVEEFHELN